MAHFWFSKIQAENALGWAMYNRAFAIINGKIAEYTEMRGNKGDGTTNFDDAVYLGEGEFHHLENR